MQDRIWKDIEQELGGVPQLLLDCGRVDDIDDPSNTGLVPVHELSAKPFVARNVHQGHSASARWAVETLKR